MKKKNIIAMILLAAAATWVFVCCGPGESTTAPGVGGIAVEMEECNLTVWLKADASFTGNPVITEVDLNGSTGGGPSLYKDGKIPAMGIFEGVRRGKPVTVKVTTKDDAVATLTVPCNTSKAAVDYPSEEYSVQVVTMPYKGVQFRFRPKAAPSAEDAPADAEISECNLMVLLTAAVAFAYEIPVVTEVETNGSVLRNSSLREGARLLYSFGDPEPWPIIGYFQGVRAGKPVTIKVKTYDGATATLVIPCDTSQVAVDFRSERYKVDLKVMENQNIRFNFAPK